MIVDVKHAAAAVGRGAPTLVFHEPGGEDVVGFVVDTGKAENLCHLRGILALLVGGGLLLGNLSLGARAILPSFEALCLAVGPWIGALVGRQLEDDLAAIVEREAAVSLKCQVRVE